MKMVNLVLDGGLSIKNIREVVLFGRFISRNQTQGYLKDMSTLSSHKQDNAAVTFVSVFCPFCVRDVSV